MHQGHGVLTEIYLGGNSAGRIRCDARLVPAPGQYLLAHATHTPGSALATPIFSAGSCQGGFHAAHPLPDDWLPGTRLNLRGPLGKGFQIPPGARFVALVSFGTDPARLLALTEPALAQGAALVLLADRVPDGLPAAIEISPLAALGETLRWADLVLVDTPRAMLPALLKPLSETPGAGEVRILVETPMPCGGVAECGVCAVRLRKGYKLACKDGPVFELRTLLGE